MVQILPAPTSFGLGIGATITSDEIIYEPQLAALREDQVAYVSLLIAEDFGIITRSGSFNLACQSLG